MNKGLLYCFWIQPFICNRKNVEFLLSMWLSLASTESSCTSSKDKCHNVWLTIYCQWRSGFFLSWTGACNIYYLCPLQPLRNDGPCFYVKGHGSSIRRHSPLCLCTACWDLLGDSVTRAEVKGFLQPASWLPACPSSSALNGHWSPSTDTVSQGGVSRYTLLPPTIILPL